MIEARKRLILDYPFWGTLALKLKLVEDFSHPRGWTDGKTLGFNPRWVDTLSMSQTIAFNAHEVGHPMLKHHLRREGRKYRLYQICCDLALNPILMEAEFDLPGEPAFEERFKGMSVEEIYKIREEEERQQLREKLKELEKKEGDDDEDENESTNTNKDENKSDQSSEDKDDEKKEDHPESEDVDNEDQDQSETSPGDGTDGGDKQDEDEGGESGQENVGNGGGGNLNEREDNQIDPDDPSDCGEVKDFPGEQTTPSKAEKNTEEIDWNISTLQATEVAKKCGETPGGMERIIEEIIHPKLDPREVFQQFIAKLAKDDYNWIQPNRRYIQGGIYLPSLKSDELLNIIFALDTSGSISEKELSIMTGWLEMILETYPAEIHAVYSDCQFQGDEIFTRDSLPLKLHPKGYGGTDFVPVFEWVEEQKLEPTCLVYMTDLCCWSFPEKEPPYPVMWIHVNKGSYSHSEPPFGDVVVMEVE